MSPRSFFIIVSKIAGLFLLKESIYLLLQLASSFSFLAAGDSFNETRGFDIVFVLYIILTVALLFLVYLFIFRPGHIINLFKLDKGFEEEKFNFSINIKHAIMIALVLIAALLLIYEIPNIFHWFYIRFYADRLSFPPSDNAGYGALIISSAKIIIGFLLVGERKRIIAYLADTEDEEETTETTPETNG